MRPSRSVVWRSLLALSLAVPLATQVAAHQGDAASVSTAPRAAHGSVAAQPQRVYTPAPQGELPTNLPSGLVHPGSVLVAFRTPVQVDNTQRHVALAAGQSAPAADIAALSTVFDGLHTTAITHLFTNLPAAQLNATRARAEAATGHYVTDFTQVYQVSFDPSINDGVAANRLAASPLVSSAMPDFIFQTQSQRGGAPALAPGVGVHVLNVAPRQQSAIDRKRTAAHPGIARLNATTLPGNYSYTTD